MNNYSRTKKITGRQTCEAPLLSLPPVIKTLEGVMKYILIIISLLLLSCNKEVAVDNSPDYADRNNDGQIDETSFYSESGDLIRIEVDTNFDGQIDEINYFEKGVTSSIKADVDFNGKYDMFYTFEYGVNKKVEIKPNESPFPIRVRNFYEDHYTEHVDLDEDGTLDQIIKYDNFERVIEKKDL